MGGGFCHFWAAKSGPSRPGADANTRDVIHSTQSRDRKRQPQCKSLNGTARNYPATLCRGYITEPKLRGQDLYITKYPLANGDLILAIPPISRSRIASLSQGKRQKKAEKHEGKS